MSAVLQSGKPERQECTKRIYSSMMNTCFAEKKKIRIKSKVTDNADSFLISLGYDYVHSGSSEVRCLSRMHRGSKEF